METPLLVALSIVVALAYLAAGAVATVVGALRAGGRRDDALDGHEAVAASRLTVPVSIIVPAAAADAAVIQRTVESLLRLAYPAFEVIVVAEASSGVSGELAEWRLEPREFFYRQTVEAGTVQRILRSQEDNRLMVVEKDAGPRSDALNTGVNLARFRFVAVVPADVTFDDGALLRAMSPALRDPAAVVAVSSHVERVEPRVASTAESRCQRLQSLRALMMTRLFWAQRSHALAPEDAVFIWRRDALVQANGFSRWAASPDADMTFRLQCTGSADERRAVRNQVPFGQAPTLPAPVAAVRTSVRQRSALQMLLTWAPSATRALRGGFGLFLRSEVLTPLAQGWIVAASIGGVAAGWFAWPTAVLSITTLAFGLGAVSAAALLIRGAHPGAPGSAELRRLLVAAPAELIWRGPRHALARVGGLSPRASGRPSSR